MSEDRSALGWRGICAERLNRLAFVKEQHADTYRITNVQKARDLDDDVAALRAGAAALSTPPAEREAVPSVPNPCSVCGVPIFGSFIGTGDGTMRDGGSFAHPDCYWRQRAEAAEAEAKRGAVRHQPARIGESGQAASDEAVKQELPRIQRMMAEREAVPLKPDDGQSDAILAAYGRPREREAVRVLEDMRAFIAMHAAHFVVEARDNTRGERIETVEYWPVKEWIDSKLAALRAEGEGGQ